MALAPARAEPDFAFDIASQPLSQALETVARTGGLQLVFSPDGTMGAGRVSLRGSFSTREALERLLRHSGLSFELVDERVVAIRRAKAEPPVETAILEPVYVVGYPPLGDGDLYNPDQAATATKTDTPLQQIPAAIEVVTQQVFKDQQILRVDKALENVSGVVNVPTGMYGGFDLFTLRGFSYGGRIYRDGVPLRVGSFWNGQREMANVERIEVLKGPTSVLYGRNDPGGMVNLITKQPEPRDYHALTQQFGSWNLFRTALDSTGPLVDDKSLSYRLNFSYETADSFRDLVGHDRKFFAPVLRWDVGPQTRINLEAEYRESDFQVSSGLPLVGGVADPRHPGRIPDVPISNYYGGTGDRGHIQEVLLGANGSHRFGEDWSLRHRFSAFFSDLDTFATLPVVASTARRILPGWPLPALADDRSVLLFQAQNGIQAETFYTALDVNGHFRTWGLDHRVLVGGDYNRSRYDYREDYFNGPSHQPITDRYSPDHSDRHGPVSGTDSYVSPESWIGFYIQDQVKLPHEVNLLAGVRYDAARDAGSGYSVSYPTGQLYFSRSTSHDQALTPRFGLSWQFVPAATVYGNYTENFGTANRHSGSPAGSLPAQRAHQWEAGLKTEWLDGQWNANLAAFRITLDKLYTTEPTCSIQGRFCSTRLGSAQTRGLEFDIKGEILQGWKLIGTYTYLDSEVLTDPGNPANVGLVFSPAPRQMGSLWTTYQWSSGSAAGLTLGGGAVVRGRRQSAIREPGYAVVNLMAAYSLALGSSRLTAQFNIDNLLDKVYYLGTDWSFLTEYPGTARSVMGSVRLEW